MVLAAVPVFAQQPPDSGSTPSITPPTSTPPQTAAPQSEAKPEAKPDTKSEVAISDTGTTFKLRVNLVQVHVIVRNAQGKTIPDLHKEDFQLLDQGKPQQISTFATETRESRLQKAEAVAKTQIDPDKPNAPNAPALPDRFVGLVFDDTHLTMEDAAYTRTQVNKFIDGIAPTDRVGIFSSSGEMTHPFTSDKEALKRTLLGLVPRSRFGPGADTGCPSISHYEADQIINFRNDQVLNVVAYDTLQCAFNGNAAEMSAAISLTQSSAQIRLTQGDTEAMFVFRFLEDVVAKMSSMPGERVMILASPGFLLTTQHLDMTEVVDRANRYNIVINTLDARGLYTPDMGDVSQNTTTYAQTAGPRQMYRTDAQFSNAAVLRDLAYGTGGVAFANSNDLAGGFNELGSAPEVSYVLGFSPAAEKQDGRYHTLKVNMVAKHTGYQVQARRGYFAPRHVDDPAQQAKADIQEAIFNRDEILDLPLVIQTQYFKTDAGAARLSVVSRMDLKGIHFNKADGRSNDSLVIATIIFDDNGNYVTGGEKTVTMTLSAPTYEKLMRSGLLVKSTFEVKPGRYLVRQVVRDSVGAQMAARNGAVEIPY